MSLYTLVADLEIVAYSKILKSFQKKKVVKSVAQSAPDETENVICS